MRKLYRYACYFLYMTIFRFTPNEYRPYALCFPHIRRFLASQFLNKCGKKINVGKNAVFSPFVTIGDESSFGARCLVESNVQIGSFVMMGPDVKILSRNHVFDSLDAPMCKQGFYEYNTVIGDDVWIGTNVIILANRKIGSHSILAAGAVITKDVPDYAIVGGNPARVIRYRRKGDRSKRDGFISFRPN